MRPVAAGGDVALSAAAWRAEGFRARLLRLVSAVGMAMKR